MKYVRDGQRVAPYCDECGCRLEQEVFDDRLVILTHFFSAMGIKDAREHPCSKINGQWHLPPAKVYALN